MLNKLCAPLRYVIRLASDRGEQGVVRMGLSMDTSKIDRVLRRHMSLEELVSYLD